MTYLSIDAETGGIGLDKSLLTLSLQAFNQEFNLINNKELFLIPDDGIYHVDPNALEVNNINLVELAKKAIPYRKAGTELYNYLKELSTNGTNKLTLVGKNVHGDVSHIQDKLLSKGSWDTFVAYNALDLSVIVQFLKESNVIPKDLNDSLTSICTFLGIQFNPHQADEDSRATMESIAALIKRIQ